MYIKISNLIQLTGAADYKSLDINKINNPVYDLENNIAYVEYTETYTPHSDLIDVTQIDYNNAKTTLTTQQGLTIEERLVAVEQAMNQFLLGGI